MSRAAERLPPPSTPDSAAGPSSSLVIPVAVALAAVATSEGYAFSVQGLTVDESYLGFLAVQGALLLLLVVAARLERRPLRDFGFTIRRSLGTVLPFATLLILLYIALRMDPGFVFGFGKIPAEPPFSFGFLLLSAPLVALAQVGLFFGYVFRSFSRRLPLRSSMLAAAGFFAANSTNFLAFPQLGLTGATEYVFSVTFVDLVLGLLLALYLYKSEWSLLGPVAFASALFAVQSLLPVGVQFPSWSVDFTSAIITYSVLLVVVGVGLREPRLQALTYLGERPGPRRHRFRDRARDLRELRSTLAGLAVVGVAALSISYGLPLTLNTQTPLLAIATGSMVPTLNRSDLVVVEHIAPAAITVGTILVFDARCLPAPTVHRVIRIVSTGPNWVYQTKGDANPTQDPCTVSYSQVLGSVVAHVPYLGFLILDPLFAGAVVVVLILSVVVWRGGRK